MKGGPWSLLYQVASWSVEELKGRRSEVPDYEQQLKSLGAWVDVQRAVHSPRAASKAGFTLSAFYPNAVVWRPSILLLGAALRCFNASTCFEPKALLALLATPPGHTPASSHSRLELVCFLKQAWSLRKQRKQRNPLTFHNAGSYCTSFDIFCFIQQIHCI